MGAIVSEHATRLVSLLIGGHRYSIRALSDRQQFADPYGLAKEAGISSALWSLFGQVWPSGKLLAQAMSDFDVAGKRILEIGCGLGLASLVLQRRGANILASDHHPLAQSFLAHNAARNGFNAPIYCDLRWAVPNPTLGRFDLIIGSDVLYERDHAAQLATLIERHSLPHSEVVITDPGRGNSGPFTTALVKLGFDVTEKRSPFDDNDLPPFRGRLLSYRR